MYIYIYIYIYIFIYMIYVYAYRYVYIYICNMYLCLCTYVYIYVYIYTYIGIYPCTYTYMINIHIYICIRARDWKEGQGLPGERNREYTQTETRWGGVWGSVGTSPQNILWSLPQQYAPIEARSTRFAYTVHVSTCYMYTFSDACMYLHM